MNTPVVPKKRGRGRPRKYPRPEDLEPKNEVPTPAMRPEIPHYIINTTGSYSPRAPMSHRSQLLRMEAAEQRGISPSNSAVQPAIPPPWADVEADGNRYTCEVCGVGGDLVCCDACPAVYHIGCIPDGPCADVLKDGQSHSNWHCPICYIKVDHPPQDNDGASQKGCMVCHTATNLSEILLCDGCDEEYHMYCLDPPLDAVPEDDWFCPNCADNRKQSKRRERIERDDFGRIKRRRGEEKMPIQEKLERHLQKQGRKKDFKSPHSDFSSKDPSFLHKSGDWLMSALLSQSNRNASEEMLDFSVSAARTMASAAARLAQNGTEPAIDIVKREKVLPKRPPKQPVIENPQYQEVLQKEIDLKGIDGDKVPVVSAIEMLARLEVLAKDTHEISHEKAHLVQKGSGDNTLTLYVPPRLHSQYTVTNTPGGESECLGCANKWLHVCPVAEKQAEQQYESTELPRPVQNGRAQPVPGWIDQLYDMLGYPWTDPNVQNIMNVIDNSYLQQNIAVVLQSDDFMTKERDLTRILGQKGYDLTDRVLRCIKASSCQLSLRCNSCNGAFDLKLSNSIVCVHCRGEFHASCVNVDTESIELLRTWSCLSCFTSNEGNRNPTVLQVVHELVNQSVAFAEIPWKDAKFRKYLRDSLAGGWCQLFELDSERIFRVLDSMPYGLDPIAMDLKTIRQKILLLQYSSVSECRSDFAQIYQSISAQLGINFPTYVNKAREFCTEGDRLLAALEQAAEVFQSTCYFPEQAAQVFGVKKLSEGTIQSIKVPEKRYDTELGYYMYMAIQRSAAAATTLARSVRESYSKSEKDVFEPTSIFSSRYTPDAAREHQDYAKWLRNAVSCAQDHQEIDEREECARTMPFVGRFDPRPQPIANGIQTRLISDERKAIDRNVRARRSKIQGIGVFATRKYNSNQVVMNYTGKIRSDRVKHACRYSIQLGHDSDRLIDASEKGNLARYLNHSCDPNCIAVVGTDGKTVVISTTREIEADEELTIDYQTKPTGVRCRCSSIYCRGFV